MRFIIFLISFFYLSYIPAQNVSREIDPPGTIQLSQNLFIDKTPVTNQMFLEYLSMKDFLRSKGYNSWKTYYIATGEKDWRRGLDTFYPSLLKGLEGKEGIVSKRGYFKDLHYRYAPVLRITKALAEDYCQWRTEMVEYAWQYFPKYEDQKRFADKIRYRLPSEEEMDAARKGFSEKNKLEFIEKKNPLKYRAVEEPVQFTLYNISEFTSTDNLYGANWKNVTPTDFPNDFTGFRCVCEVME